MCRLITSTELDRLTETELSVLFNKVSGHLNRTEPWYSRASQLPRFAGKHRAKGHPAPKASQAFLLIRSPPATASVAGGLFLFSGIHQITCKPRATWCVAACTNPVVSYRAWSAQFTYFRD